MERKIVSFEDLKCWKACRTIRKYTMSIIKAFPGTEKYALTDGMRRSARSTTENITEGYGRYHYGENIQFCRISRGSLFELKDQFIAAFDDNYITKVEFDQGKEMINSALNLLNGYINYLQKAKEKNNSVKNNIMKEESSIYDTPID